MKIEEESVKGSWCFKYILKYTLYCLFGLRKAPTYTFIILYCNETTQYLFTSLRILVFTVIMNWISHTHANAQTHTNTYTGNCIVNRFITEVLFYALLLNASFCIFKSVASFSRPTNQSILHVNFHLILRRWYSGIYL